MQNKKVKEILDRMNEVSLSFTENPAPDFTSYRERLGRYSGLKEALDILTNAENEDDDN